MPTKRVLVVEDDLALADLLGAALVDFYDVRTVSDGADAVNVAMEYRPDVILLDIKLPNKDGFEIAQELKSIKQLGRVPIIFVTAQDRSTDIVKGIQAGAKHYITKPFKMEDVLAKVKKLVPV